MSIIAKYLVREMMKYFGFMLAAVIILYLVVDFFDRIDNFIDADLPAARMLYYLWLQIPIAIARITPVGVMLATLIERDGRELPIQANVVGRHVDLQPDEHIKLTGPDPLRLEIKLTP